MDDYSNHVRSPYTVPNQKLHTQQHSHLSIFYSTGFPYYFSCVSPFSNSLRQRSSTMVLFISLNFRPHPREALAILNSHCMLDTLQTLQSPDAYAQLFRILDNNT